MIDGVSGRLVPVEPGALAEALVELVADAQARARLGAFARIALESRYSPAAAALSLDAIFRSARAAGRHRHGLAFAPAMLGHFPFAARRQPGAAGTVPAPSRPLVRRLRRAKQMRARAPDAALRRAAACTSRRACGGAPGDGSDAATPQPRRIYLDQTHLRGHVTGIERVALDLFAPDALGPHEVRPRRQRVAARHDRRAAGRPAAARCCATATRCSSSPAFPRARSAPSRRSAASSTSTTPSCSTRPEDLSLEEPALHGPSFALALRWCPTCLVNTRTTGEAVRAVCADDALVALLRPAVRDVFGLAGLPGPAAYDAGTPLRLLAIGTIEPRKDYPAALALTAALNRAGVPAELHLVGPGRLGPPRLPATTRPPSCTWHGYLGDAALRGARRRAATSCSRPRRRRGSACRCWRSSTAACRLSRRTTPVFREVLGASGLLIHPADPEGAAPDPGCLGRAPAAFAGGAGPARANVARWNAWRRTRTRSASAGSSRSGAARLRRRRSRSSGRRAR